jgi:hypothetical protein
MTPDFEVTETGTRKALTEKDMEIERLKELVRMGRAVVDDFLPNVGTCALQDYGRLNEFLMQTKEFEDGNE